MFKIDHVTDELSLARLRAAHERPYFATALFRMVPVLTDKLPTLAVDRWWRMYYNNDFLKQHTPQENATALLHEVEHLLRNHAGRCEMNGCEHEQFNLAGDLEINDDLDADPRLKLPRGVLNPKTWRDDLAKGLVYPHPDTCPSLGGSGGRKDRDRHAARRCVESPSGDRHRIDSRAH